MAYDSYAYPLWPIREKAIRLATCLLKQTYNKDKSMHVDKEFCVSVTLIF